MNKYPDMVWFIEDQADPILSLRKFLKADKEEENFHKLKVFDTPEEVKELLLKKETVPPEVLLLDICLKSGEDSLVTCKKDSFDKMNNLAQVSGIEFLNWLRCYLPGIPVVISSGYWDKKDPHLPDLSQHAICNIPKPVKPSISNILWIAQQVIIGIRLPIKLRAGAKKIIEEVNQKQNYFYFIVCEKEEDLSSPPTDLKVGEKEELLMFFGVWNKRVLGLLEDNSFKGKAEFKGVLPFGRSPLRRFSISLKDDVEWMGENYLGVFLLRECARAAYLLFFDIKPHPINTGECIFDSSAFTPDVIQGIIKRNEPCPECKSQMKPFHSFGGWSKGRGEAARKIMEMAKREYEKAINKKGGS